MRFRSFLILGIILFSLAPLYFIQRFLQKKIRPRESGRRLLFYLLLNGILILVFTFLLVFLIQTLFPLHNR